MAIRFIKTDPIAELTEEIKDLKQRIKNLETTGISTSNIQIRPQEERIAVYTSYDYEIDIEEEIPFLPKPKFGDMSLKKMDIEQQEFDSESVKKLREKKSS